MKLKRIQRPWYFMADPADPPGGGGAGDPPAGDPPTPPAGDPWHKALPTDWRDQLATAVDPKAAGDYKSMLDRYTDLPAFVKAAREAQQKIRQGLAAGDTPPEGEAELKAWREAKGIPESPEGYKFEPPEGITLSETDNQLLGATAAVALKHNIPATVMNELAAGMLQERMKLAEARQQQDNLEASETTAMLQKHWGSEFQVNERMAKAFIAGMPEELADIFANSRGPDGKALLNHPEMIQYLADAQRKINPVATVIPDGNGGLDGVEAEIKKLESQMGTDEWYADPAKAARYQQLIDARDAAARQK